MAARLASTGMDRWPIERLWDVERVVKPRGDGAGGAPTTGSPALGSRTPGTQPGEQFERWEAQTSELAASSAVIVLGAAGLGKTFEMRRLEEFETRNGSTTQFERLASFAWDESDLERRLASLVESREDPAAIYLDGLDEMLVSVTRASAVIKRWIELSLAEPLPKIRIACRSAVWPEAISKALHARYGTSKVVTARLRPLDLDRDVREIARASEIDPDRFVEALRASRAVPLAEQPLTLRLLMNQFKRNGALPSRRIVLFESACDDLAAERTEREDASTADDVDRAAILNAAELLACAMVLSGKDRAAVGDADDEHTITRSAVERLIPEQRVRDALRRRALMESSGPGVFQFAQRQIAEYLAGRRIASLQPMHARRLLAGPGGWRDGVPGPLRETAAFAAMHKPDLAGWIVGHDPEVIGLSDVADDAIRQAAALAVIDECRRGERNPPSRWSDSAWLRGVRFEGAAQALAPVVRDPSEPEAARMCAIEFLEAWREAGAADALAEVALNDDTPLQLRRSAAYAMRHMDAPDARRRIKPLAFGVPGDEQHELRGLALECLWPGGLTVHELLDAIGVAEPSGYVGSYWSFLHRLGESGFAADGHRVEGLRWILRGLRAGVRQEVHGRLFRNIIEAAFEEIGDAPTLDALAELLIEMSKHQYSVIIEDLFSVRRRSEHPFARALRERPELRRTIFDAVVGRRPSVEDLRGVLWSVAGAVSSDDIEWLLDRACDADRAPEERQRWAAIGTHPITTGSPMPHDVLQRLIPYLAEPMIDEALRWLRPVALGSQEELRQRREFAQRQEHDGRLASHRTPTAADVISNRLNQCERADPWWFEDLTTDLFLVGERKLAPLSLQLTESPQWQGADEATRARIVAAAKSLLGAERRPRVDEMTSHCRGALCALWLLLTIDPVWCDALEPAWWQRWSPFLFPRLINCDEAEASTPHLLWTLDRLQTHALAEVREMIRAWALGGEGSPWAAGFDPLARLGSWQDPSLDDALFTLLSAPELRAESVGPIVEYLAPRQRQRTIEALRPWFEAALPEEERELHVIDAGIAFLVALTDQSWELVIGFARRNPTIGKRLLERLADAVPDRGRKLDRPHPLRDQPSSRVAELLGLYLEHFPTRDDPDYTAGVRAMTPDDGARWFRSGLTNMIHGRNDLDAVRAISSLAERFREQEPWLDRIRIDIKRANRLSAWSPVPPEHVARLLDDAATRVFRSEGEVLDFIEEQAQRYAVSLQQSVDGAPLMLEDLWNSDGDVWTPKNEERLSDVFARRLREGVDKAAVGVTRETQIRRRATPKDQNGAPGEEPDILIEVSGSDLAEEIRLMIPVEVKLAHNREVRSALREQLHDRYMRTLNARAGVYVVGWFGKWKGQRGRARSAWTSVDEARAELEREAKLIAQQHPGTDIRVVVIDASLPSAASLDKAAPQDR